MDRLLRHSREQTASSGWAAPEATAPRLYSTRSGGPYNCARDPAYSVLRCDAFTAPRSSYPILAVQKKLMHRLIAGLLGALCFPTPSAAQFQPPACMDLSLGAWTPAMEVGADSLYLAPPPRVYFDTVRFTRGASVAGDDRRLVPAPGALPSVHRIAAWRRAADGTIEVMWSNGFSGLQGALRREGDTWIGEVRSFWDFDRPVQVAQVSGEVVSCESPLPLENRLRYSLIRGIRFEQGDSLQLGEPLLPGHDGLLQRARFTYAYRQKVSGHFVGADSVRATVNEIGRVRDIRLRMPIPCGQLAARLEERVGAPTSSSQGPPVSMISWFSRNVSLTLVAAGSGACGVMLRDPSAR